MSAQYLSAVNLKLNTTYLMPHFPYEHLSDARTQRWLLVNSFWNVAALVILYLLMVRYLPRWTQRRKPFRLKYLLIVYNMSMAFLNARICRDLFMSAWRLKYNYWCQPCRVIYSKDEIKMASAIWWFFFSKLLEFADTLFFILRKKSQQLTFLHVYHHSTMFPLWWIAIKWVPTGSSMLNSFVHIVMYSYYGLAAMGPSVQKYLSWKKYLTLLQLVQFFIGVAWATQALISRCDFPAWINWVSIFYLSTFLILFGRFYLLKYQRKIK